MQASPCQTAEELTRFALGELSESELETVAGHVEGCAGCQARLQAVDISHDRLLVRLRAADAADPYQDEVQRQRAYEIVRSLGSEISSQAAMEMVASPAGQAGELAGTLGEIREYRLLEKLGQGGMGAVYKALHTRLKRIVAIKVLPPECMHDSQAVARFEREMEAVGRLDHAHIVRATDAGVDQGQHFLVMEFVDGLDLAALARRAAPLRVNDACELIRQAAVGLQSAHEQKLVHRDIKPSNLMLTRKGQVKLLDLGLALLHERTGDLTSTGQVMGTLDYMAPEQGGDSHLVNIQADIYSLGATLYRLLAGEAPFSGAKYATLVQKLTAKLTLRAPRLDQARRDVTPPLAQLVDRMLRADPKDRPATPAEVADALGTHVAGHDLVALIERAMATDPARAVEPVSSHSTGEQSRSAETDEYLASDVKLAPSQPEAREPKPTPQAEPSVKASELGASLAKMAPLSGAARAADSIGQASHAARQASEHPVAYDHRQAPLCADPERDPRFPRARRFTIRGRRMAVVAAMLIVLASAYGLTMLNGPSPWNVAMNPQDNTGTEADVNPREDELPLKITEKDINPDGPLTPRAVPDVPEPKIVDMKSKDPSRIGRDTASEVELDSRSLFRVGRKNREPLQPFALVRYPRVVPDLVSWTVETIGHRAGITGLAFGPARGTLATADDQGTVRIWKPGTEHLDRILMGSGEAVTCLAWSPDETWLATGYAGSRVAYAWHVASGRRYEIKSDGVPTLLAWSHKGNTLALRHKQLQFWTPSRPKRLFRDERLADLGQFYGWSPQENLLTILGQDGTLQLVDGKSHHIVHACRSADEPWAGDVRVRWSPTGEQLALVSAGEQDQVFLIDAQATRAAKLRHSFTEPIQDVAWSPDGLQLAVLEANDNLRTFDAGLGVETHLWHDLEIHAGSTLGWTPDKAHLLVGARDGSLFQVDAETSATKRAYGSHPALNWQCLTWPKNQGPEDQEVIIADGTRADRAAIECDWNVLTGSLVARDPVHGDVVLARAANNRRFVAGNAVQEPESALAVVKPPLSLNLEPDATSIYAFSVDGNRLAISRQEPCAVLVYDLREGRVTETIPMQELVTGLAFSPDGSQIVASSAGQNLWQLEGNLPATRITQPARGPVAFSPDGKLLALSQNGNSLLILNEAREKVAEYQASAAAFTSLAWSPDGGVVATCGRGINAGDLHADGTIRFWQAKDGKLLASAVYLNAHQGLFVSASGHYRTTPESARDQVVYVVQSVLAQETLTPAEFEARYGWRNDPNQVHWATK